MLVALTMLVSAPLQRSAIAAETRAREITPLERVSFRAADNTDSADVDQEVNDTASQTQASASAPEPPAPSGESALVLEPALDDPWDFTNQLFERSVHQTMLPSSLNGGLGWPSDERGSRWHLSGEIAAGGGEATWAERELFDFILRETYLTNGGDEIEFYQSYNRDHSWANGSTLTIGARQDLPQVLWNGDLVLTEEYKRYRDRDYSAYDRNEGLFKLRFTPEWAGGKTRARLEYKYNVRSYTDVSPNTYKMNQARLRIEREFDATLKGEVSGELTRYKYGDNSLLSNNGSKTGARLEWQPADWLKLSAVAKNEERTYINRDQFSYTRDTLGLTAALRPDTASSLTLSAEQMKKSIDSAPGAYDDTRYSALYTRSLNPRLDLSAKYEDRRKRYDVSPIDNLDQRYSRLALDYYPAQAWNLRLDLARRSSDYALSARSYDADETALYAWYTKGAWRLGAEVRRRDQGYKIDTRRDYTLDEWRIDASYNIHKHRLSAFYSNGRLDQIDPQALNDYTETHLGAMCDWWLAEGTDFIVSYDDSNRDYRNGYNIEESLLEARLTFEF